MCNSIEASLGLEANKVRKGRPSHTWLCAIEADLRPLNTGLSSAWKKATSRESWRSVMDRATLKKSVSWEGEVSELIHHPSLPETELQRSWTADVDLDQDMHQQQWTRSCHHPTSRVCSCTTVCLVGLEQRKCYNRKHKMLECNVIQQLHG